LLAPDSIHFSRQHGMTAETLVRSLLLASITLLVVGLGLRSTPSDVAFLFRRPKLLVQALVAMYVVLPLIVIGVLMHLNLRPSVKIALAALALSPVPPFLPVKQMKLAPCKGYIYGLLVAASLVAVAFVPAVTWALEARWSLGRHVPAATVLKIIVLTVLLPLAIGMVARRLVAERAQGWAGALNVIGNALLFVAFVPVLVAQWGSVLALIGDGTLLAIVAFTCVGLLVGHVLGGPDLHHRTVLALATSSRHPAVALAIASIGFPEQPLAPAAVMLAMLVSIMAAAPYASWRRRVYAAGVVETESSMSTTSSESPHGK
jgi:bile acid:Na+ symporter, BASS family